MKNTHALVILDRSGSMQSIKGAMEEAFNGWIEAQKSEPGNMTVSLVQFDAPGYSDDWYLRVYEALPLKEVPKLTIYPRGGTALYDAVTNAIKDLDLRLESSLVKPDQIMVVIITDGDENSSRYATAPSVKRDIEFRQGRGWNFTFLGANQDAFKNAANIGISQGSTLNFRASTMGTTAAGAALSSYTSTLRNVGVAAYTDTDRENADK